MRKKILIPKEDLIRLYSVEKKSKYKIAKIYGCSFATVRHRLEENNIKKLPDSVLRNRYSKFDFSKDSVEKAYIIGFRLGDLNVYKKSVNSETIVVRCHTTQRDQVDLMEKLFSRYGQVTVSCGSTNKNYHVNCFLNKTFEFLLKKSDIVDNWIDNSNEYSWSFAAGYTDAEGNIGVYDKRARFKIDSYDKNTIFWLKRLFEKNEIFCPEVKKIGEKGQIYEKIHGYKYNKDLWRIRVSELNSLHKLLILLKPYLRHKKRVSDLNNCLINIDGRRKKQ